MEKGNLKNVNRSSLLDLLFRWTRETRNSAFETSISWIISNNLPIDVLKQPSATNEEKYNLLLLSYQGQKGDFALKSMRKRSKTLLPHNFNTQIAFKGKKLKSYFKFKNNEFWT